MDKHSTYQSFEFGCDMFFNGMDMDKLLYKRQSNLGIEKSLRVK